MKRIRVSPTLFAKSSRREKIETEHHSDERREMRSLLTNRFAAWSGHTALDSKALAEMLQREGMTPERLSYLLAHDDLGNYLRRRHAKVSP